MSEKVGAIHYEIDFDTAKLIDGQRKAQRSLSDLGDAGDRLQSKMSGVAAAIASMFAAGAIVNEFRKASEAAKLFERAVDNLSSITGATGNQLKILENAAKDFGNSTSASALQAVEAMKLIASAKPELLENAEALKMVTAQAVILADASGMSLPQAADSLTLALNQMGAGADQAGRYINVMAAGAKFGASEIAQSTDALKQFAVSAKGVGLSIEEANAGIQALAAVGIKGGEAGTALRNVLLKLETEADTKLKPSLNGLAGALDNLSAKNLSTAELTKLFGLENINASNALMGNTEQIRLLTAQLTGTQTAIEQAKTNTDNYEGSLRRMQNALEGAYTEMGAKFNPILKSGADLITQLAVEVSQGSERIEAAISFISVAAVAAAGSLSGSLVVSLYASIRAMSAATVAARTFSGVMSLMGGPIGIAITALALLALNWDKVTGATKDAAEMSEQAAQRIQNALTKTPMKAAADLSNQLKEVNDEISSINKELEYKGPGQADQSQLKELKERLATLTQIRQEIERAAKTTGGGAGRGSVNPEVVTPRSSGGGGGGGTKGRETARFDVQGYLAGIEQATVTGLAAIDLAEQEAMRRNDELLRKKNADERISLEDHQRAKLLIQTKFQQDREALEAQAEQRRKTAEEQARQKTDASDAATAAANKFASDILTEGDPVARIKAQYQAKEDALNEHLATTDMSEQLHAQAVIANRENMNKALADLDKQKASQQLAAQAQLLNGTSQLFGNLADLAKQGAGEQSDIFKAMFVAQKAFAIASAIINIQTAMSSAAMSLPFPANLGAIGTVLSATAGIVSTISSTNLSGGRQYGGAVNSGNLYRVNEKGAPEMFTAANGSQYMMPTASGRVTAADQVGSGALKLTIINNTSVPIGQVTERSIGDGERALIISEAASLVAAQLGDPNSGVSRSMSRNFSTQRSR